jgi:D-3-phosphoglycerate dehydrogenase
LDFYSWKKEGENKVCKVALVFPESFVRFVEKMKRELERENCEVEIALSERPITQEEKRLLLARNQVYVTGGVEKITASDLEGVELLKLIQRFGAGYENVDYKAAAQKGIYVANIPGANADSVADLTIGLIIALLRNVVKADTLLRRGIWRFWIGWELAGKVLGILGLGAIGKAVALRARAHGMKVIAFDIQPDLDFARKNDVKLVSKEELLRASDIVTIHMPLTETTRNFIAQSEFALMKPGAYLVNTSRGGLVDHAALIDALQSQRIAGAALDVFYEEPLPKEDRVLQFDNVVLTPHIGGSTVEALERLSRVVIENCLRVKRGERPLYLVNSVD